MPHQYILQNSEVLKKLAELKQMLITFQLDNESGLNQFLKWSTIAVVIIGIGGQYWIFKLNKQKEIKLQVAILYAKFKSTSIKFPYLLQEFNTLKLIYLRYQFLSNYYKTLDNGSDPKLTVKYANKASSYETEYYKAVQIYNKTADKLNVEKMALLELLHQIHFYSNHTELNNLIKVFTLDDGVKVDEKYHRDLERIDFIELLYEDKMVQSFNNCTYNFEAIANTILTIS